MSGKTRIRATHVNEDTLQDADADTMVSVEANADEDKIRFMTANTERMIIQDDGKVGIGDNITPGYKLDVDGDVRIRGGDIRDNSGEKVIEMDGSGYLKFTKGIKYARGVLVTSSSSPTGSGGTPDGGWVKFATFSCPGTSNLDTAASSFLVTMAGMESSNNRALDGTFLVHAKFTVNTTGTGTDGASVSNAHYEPEGTRIYCEPLNAEFLSASGVNEFDPQTDLLMIFPNNTSTPDVDLYIRACAKQKRCFATHLGGTGQVDTFDTDIGFTINTGQGWSATEPAAPANNVKLTGSWASKVFSKVTVYNVLEANSLETNAMTVNVRDVNSTSTVQDSDYLLRCTQNQAITITLPPKNTNQGRVLIFKDALGNANSNNITIAGDGSDTIDGNANYVINDNKEAITLICDGINGWMRTSRIVP